MLVDEWEIEPGKRTRSGARFRPFDRYSIRNPPACVTFHRCEVKQLNLEGECS